MNTGDNKQDKVSRRGLEHAVEKWMCEHGQYETEWTAIYYYGLLKKNSRSEKKVYFITVFHFLFSMFYTWVLLCILLIN